MSMGRSSLMVYRAGAGSGKTFALTVEYIRLMVGGTGDEFAHSLAVTFTNKATAEMKDRIVGHLYGIWRGIGSSESVLTAVQGALAENGVRMDVEEIRARCGVALRGILHDYSHFRVETIDSFFQSVLRCLARELGLGCNLQVDLRDAEVAALAVDRLIDGLEGDGELQRIVMDYIRDEMERVGKWNVQRGLKGFSAQIFGEDFCGRTDGQRRAMQDVGLARGFRRAMRVLRDESNERITDLTRGMLDAFMSVGDLETWCGKSMPAITFLNNVLAGKDYTKTREGKKFGEFLEDGASALLKAFRGDEGCVAAMRELSGRFGEYLKALDGVVAEYNTAVLALRYAYPLQLLCRIDEEVRRINEENERFSLSKTPTLLSRLVDGQDCPFVFEKIGTVLRNVMIDEFQDTSRLQWDNFRVLLAECLSMGGSGLLVGDVKQSIYRWRGGDWSLLRDVTETMRAWNPEVRSLSTNWRSDRNIVEFNNGFFSRAAALLDGLDAGARFCLKDIYEDVVQRVPEHKGDGGFVSLNIYNGSSADKSRRMDRDEILAWRLEGMMEEMRTLRDGGLPLEEMAVIVRYNYQAAAILDFFERSGAAGDIVLRSDEAYLLENSTLVRIMICVLRMLVTDVRKNPVPTRLFLLLYYREVLKVEIATDDLMHGEAEELLPGWLRGDRAGLAEVPLLELLGEIYRRLDLQRLKGQDAYHFALLDCVMDYLRENPGDIHSFLTAWDEGLRGTAVPAARAGGVRVLTLHKSKGLEFHTVFIPFADFSIEAESATHETILWCEAEGLDEANVLGKLPIRLSKEMGRSRYAGCFREEHLQRRVDELNALYVAMTRASHNMFLWCVTGNRLDCGSSTGDLLNAVMNPGGVFDGRLFCMCRGERVYGVDAEKGHDNRMDPRYEGHVVAMSSYSPRMDFRQSSEARELLTGLADGVEDAETHDDGASMRVLGAACHYVLEQIRDWNDVERVLDVSVRNGTVDADGQRVLRGQLRQIRENPVVRGWFDPENRVFTECDILMPRADGRGKRSCRPDRVVMRDGVITVIDYKFGEEHEGYSGQVRGYMSLLREMYPGMKVLGYLWFVRRAVIKEVVL